LALAAFSASSAEARSAFSLAHFSNGGVSTVMTGRWVAIQAAIAMTTTTSTSTAIHHGGPPVLATGVVAAVTGVVVGVAVGVWVGAGGVPL
jgi:hypothetical protein